MRLHRPSLRQLAHVCETLLIGAIGSFVFRWLHLPGGLITGAMIAVAAASMAGRPLGLPPFMAHVILMTLGISLGSMVSPKMLANAAAYPLSIALLAAATFCSVFGSAAYLQRFHGWDRTSALLAGSPGALSQIIMLATERGADVPGIAVVQIMRVMILTAALPLLLAAAGLSAGGALPHLAEPATPLALAGLVVASIAAALVLRWLNFPASWMFGAMLGSSVLHGVGWVDGGLPLWAYVCAVVGIGILIGTRFARIAPRTIVNHLIAAVGSFGVAIVISAIFVAITLTFTSGHFADVIVAYAPGAMDAMLALALTLHIDPIFVGAHHLARFVFVSVATPGIVHLFGRQQADADD